MTGLSALGSMVMKWIPASAKVWGGVMLKSLSTALLPVDTMVLTALNPIGWATAILGGVAVIGNYLPTLMYKTYDNFISLFSEENMSKIWDFCKTSARSMFEKFYEWLGKGLFGIGLVLESIFYTAVNALGNGLQMMIKNVTLGAVDIGKFEYQSSGYANYLEQKKTHELQAQLDEQREAQAKREKQIAEFKMKVSDQEREWLDKEEALLKKCSELAEGRFDSAAKAAMASNRFGLGKGFL